MLITKGRSRLDFQYAFVISVLLAVVIVGLLMVSSNMLLYAALALIGLVIAEALAFLWGQGSQTRVAILAAWVVRLTVLVALVIRSSSVGRGSFYLRQADATNYHMWAQMALRSGQSAQYHGLPAFTGLVAFLYRVFGVDPNVVDLVNVGAGVVTVPLVYDLTVRLGGRRAGHIAAWMLAFYPSHVLWSVSGVKDVWIVLGIVMTAYLVVGIASRDRETKDLVSFVIGLVLIACLRFQVVLSLVIALLGSGTLVSNGCRRRRLKYLLICVVMAMAILGSTVGLKAISLVSEVRTEEYMGRAEETAFAGGSGIRVLEAVPIKYRWIAQLPFVIFAPFPWQWLTTGTGINRLVGLEMAVVYMMLATVVAKKGTSKLTAGSRALLLYAFAIALAVSFSLPNLGSIHRYRAAATVLLLAAYAIQVGGQDWVESNGSSKQSIGRQPQSEIMPS